jgi:hypothetical protein
MISTGSTLVGSFDVNCPVPFSDGLETEESCGVQKTITWTTGGTKSNDPLYTPVSSSSNFIKDYKTYAIRNKLIPITPLYKSLLIGDI